MVATQRAAVSSPGSVPIDKGGTADAPEPISHAILVRARMDLGIAKKKVEELIHLRPKTSTTRPAKSRLGIATPRVTRSVKPPPIGVCIVALILVSSKDASPCLGASEPLCFVLLVIQ